MNVYVILALGFGDDEDAEDVYGVRTAAPAAEVAELCQCADEEFGGRVDGRVHYRYEEHELM